VTCPLVGNDGAYVLGALPAEDRLRYEQHLQVCPVCAAAVAELAGIPGLLARLPVERPATADGTAPGPGPHPSGRAPAGPDTSGPDTSGPDTYGPDPAGSDPAGSDPSGPNRPGSDPLGADPPVPETLLPALLRRVRRERRRSRLRLGLAAGVAAAVLAVTGTVAVEHLTRTGLTRTGPGPVATRTVALRPVGTATARGTALLTAREWGSMVQVSCQAEPGYGGEPSYTLYLTDRAGHRSAAASWRAPPDQDVTVVGASGLSPQDVVRLEVSDEHGTVVMRGAG
jgi:hypothetical protein